MPDDYRRYNFDALVSALVPRPVEKEGKLTCLFMKNLQLSDRQIYKLVY